jgi:hypothetical protein
MLQIEDGKITLSIRLDEIRDFFTLKKISLAHWYSLVSVGGLIFGFVTCYFLNH